VKKERVDALLVARGLCESREQAKRLVLAGEVRSGDRVVDKPSTKFPEDAPLEVKEKPRYVGRGGLKMEGALAAFGISPEGWTCLDIGASTGGFTDCLLQHGAVKVHAIDVGTNQLAYKLRTDPRVVVKEQFNARGLEVKTLGEKVRMIVMDLSFISLTKILPAAFGVLEDGGYIGKGGIVRDPELHQRAVDKIRTFVTEELGREWKGLIDSPITGTDGNREFLAWLG
jgi:23S rRNA (cytidine1920-2'-O)/16S rRNA (cytidine1409-2'-O)-methyltransferase